jgi:hypothetical protein
LNKRKLIKGTRWLLLKNSQNLAEEKNEEYKLELVLSISKVHKAHSGTTYRLIELLNRNHCLICEVVTGNPILNGKKMDNFTSV